MFTGLAMGMGEVLRSIPGTGESRFAFRPLFSSPAWNTGESIAINGACLSVESLERDSFTAYASQETLSKSNLSALTTGARVNLERALALGDRLGGHLVSGHVDCLAEIASINQAGSSRIIRVTFPEEFASQVIVKGSVALDGVSLTINLCGPDFLEVNVIPETLRTTTAGQWQVGRQLNFETDMIAKYVERMIKPWRSTAPKARLTMDFLREQGF